MKISFNLLVACALCAMAIITQASEKTDATNDDVSYRSHVELGEVHWHRNFEKAKAISKKTGRPLLVLFQEIPGCQTCQNFGKQPLSHPLVVEAMEDLFVPVTIFNNKEGRDKQLLTKFSERAWNNPVVRFMTADETDILDRKDGLWSTQAIVHRMIQALEKAGKPVPNYLKQITFPAASEIETAEFAMHCYWVGEVRLGSIPGVFSTRSGWRDNLEVVQVKFDPSVVSYEKLLATAMKLECASKVFAHTDTQLQIAKARVGQQATQAVGKMRDAKSSDQKYHLTKTPLRHLPLTEIQATKINAIGQSRKSPLPMLSPRQRDLFKRIANLNSTNPAALKSLRYPQDQSELGVYQAKLLQTLGSSIP